MSRNDRLIKACQMIKDDCTPVWFMRQAGRYMKQYRDIRDKCSLMEMFKHPELAATVTLQPVRAFAVDAAIIFADILLPLEPMGISLDFVEGRGPVIKKPVRTPSEVNSLRIVEPESDLDFVLESLRLVRQEIDGRVALIGFAGAPFTLASYAIEGASSSSYILTKGLMYENGSAWNLLMEKFCASIVSFLKAQVKAGAQVVQLFDSWAGCLSPADYESYVLPHNKRIFEALRQDGIPSIHFSTGTAGLLPQISAAGGDIIGVDWRISLENAWQRIRPGAGIQGNLDPVALMAPWPVLRRKSAEILDQAGGRPGHIFNLGHGVLPSTPEDSIRAVAEFVHEYSSGPAEHAS
jgi:uroporphyrinogen decarboxylase